MGKKKEAKKAAKAAQAARLAKSAVSVFKELEDRVANAVSPAEERQARQQLAAAKMIANENRRERDPEVLMRTMKGLGVPLLTNSHALPDDRELRGV